MGLEISTIKQHYLPRPRGECFRTFFQCLIDDRVICKARGESTAVVLATLDELRAIAAELFQSQPANYKRITDYLDRVLALRKLNSGLIHLYIRW